MALSRFLSGYISEAYDDKALLFDESESIKALHRLKLIVNISRL